MPQGGSGNGGETLYVGDAEGFVRLGAALNLAGLDASETYAGLAHRAAGGGDPFGQAAADAAYASHLRTSLSALENLSLGLRSLAEAVDQAGVLLTETERGLMGTLVPASGG